VTAPVTVLTTCDTGFGFGIFALNVVQPNMSTTGTVAVTNIMSAVSVYNQLECVISKQRTSDHDLRRFRLILTDSESQQLWTTSYSTAHHTTFLSRKVVILIL